MEWLRDYERRSRENEDVSPSEDKMAISKGNLAHDRGENVTSKSVRQSLVSTWESGENVMQNPTNDRRWSRAALMINPWGLRWFCWQIDKN